jgi:hypothetical protein
MAPPKHTSKRSPNSCLEAIVLQLACSRTYRDTEIATLVCIDIPHPGIPRGVVIVGGASEAVVIIPLHYLNNLQPNPTQKGIE